MQLLLLGLALGVFVHDATPPGFFLSGVPAGWLLAAVVLPKVGLAVAYAWACRGVIRGIGGRAARARLTRVNRWSALLPAAGLALFALDLYLGWLGLIRGAGAGYETTGPRDWVLVDEVVAMLPTLLLVASSWWAYYPIDRRLREVSILRRADAGLPLYPIWTRGQYVVTQARNQMAMILGPLLLIMAWSETLVKLHAAGWIDATQQLWLTPVGAAGVFFVSPLLLKHLWDTVPLPPGPVREKLQAMCGQHGVRVADLLLWRSFGGMINAAVMGFFGPVRYILLSDGLLDQVPEHEVEAVMAHELAHVRLRHLWWLLAGAGAGAVGIAGLGDAAMSAAAVRPEWVEPWWAQPVVMVGGLLGWVLWFGFVSRRIERQADTFAARHMQATLTREGVEPDDGTFSAGAVSAMVHALQRVADLNHVAPTRRSWRHGSIAWRQNYLRGLVGTPLGATAVDRQLKWVKIASLTLLVAYTAGVWWGVV